jgi:hypothetical protein
MRYCTCQYPGREGGSSLPSQPGFKHVSLNATATYRTHPNRAPGGVPAGGSTHAGTVDHVHTGAACFADLRDHAVRLLKRGDWCCLCDVAKARAKATAINLIIVLPYDPFKKLSP